MKLSELNTYEDVSNFAKEVAEDVYKIDTGEYLPPEYARKLAIEHDYNYVPVIENVNDHFSSIDDYLKFAEGKSVLNNKTEREGVVVKSNDGKTSFKVISNKFLLKEK